MQNTDGALSVTPILVEKNGKERNATLELNSRSLQLRKLAGKKTF